MRLIITGGGTGGHIYPAIAIAKKVRKGLPDCDILYVGGRYGLEKDIVKREGIAFEGITVRGIDRRNIFKAIKALFMVVGALYQSFAIMRRFKPDLVIGTGGYVSGPVVMMASLMGIDTMIHEQNVIPGFTTRRLSRHAKKILISFKETIPYFKEKNKLYYTGVPVREIFNKVNREQARKDLYINENDKLIVSLGGSNGAVKINEISQRLAYRISDYDNVRYFHITGKRFYDKYIETLDNTKICERVTILEYIDDIATLLAASDLVISRSGALSLAEFIALNLPAILIPSPNVANNHQTENARVFEKTGAAIVLEEKELDFEDVMGHIDGLLENPEKLEHMRKMYQKFPMENALNTIMSMVYSYHLR